MKRKILLKIGLLILSIIVFLIISEITGRIIYPEIDYHSEFENFYKSNNLIIGLEEKDNINELVKIDNLKNETYNIVIIGDSISYGLGVNKSDRFSNVLQNMIKEKYPDFNFTIINIATTSYSTIQELESFKKYFSDKKVDLVIIGYALNDPGEAMSSTGIWRLENLYSRKELRQREKAILDEVNATKFCRFRNIFRGSVFLQKTGLINILFFKGAPIFGTFFDYIDSKKYFIVKHNDACFWQEITYSFSELEKLSKEGGFDVLEITFPILFNDYTWNNYPLNSIHEKVNNEALKNNLYNIDLLNTFNKYSISKTKRTGLMDTIHPNEFGHKLVAEQIMIFLEKTKFNQTN